MNIEQSTVQKIVITDLQDLDPIRVYVENYEPGRGRITITCFNQAWVNFWGAMAGRTIEQFILDCDDEYLASKLVYFRPRTHQKDIDYLVRIIRAVKQAFRQMQEVPA